MHDQLTLPYVVGSDTSRAAAEAEAEKAMSDVKKILELFQLRGSYGLTDQEIEKSLGLRQSTASARRRGLVLSGKVVNSGGYRPTRSGNKAAVWVLAGVDRHPSIPEMPPVAAKKTAKSAAEERGVRYVLDLLSRGATIGTAGEVIAQMREEGFV